MRFTIIICSFLVGIAFVSNVDSTFHEILGGLLLGGGGLNPHHRRSHHLPGFEIFDEFFNVVRKIFGDSGTGLNVFLDDFNRGISSVLDGSFGAEKLEKFLGPLSQIPDGADLPALLGEKFQSKADIFGMLIPLAKKFCISGQCQKLEVGNEEPLAGSGGIPIGGKFQQGFADFLASLDHEIKSGLNSFNSDMEGLIKSLLDNGKHNALLGSLSKLPENFDPTQILGKDGSSKIIDGKFSREDILPLLVQFSKSKCSKGCDES